MQYNNRKLEDRVSLTVYTNREFVKAIKSIAKKERRSLSNYIEYVLCTSPKLLADLDRLKE
jgi:hypothetical protein